MGIKRNRPPKKIYPYAHDIFRARYLSIMGKTDLNQTEVAKLMGIEECTLSSWATGFRMPNAINLRLFCTSMNVSADYLLGLSDDESIRK